MNKEKEKLGCYIVKDFQELHGLNHPAVNKILKTQTVISGVQL